MFDLPIFLWTIFLNLVSSAVPLAMIIGFVALFVKFGRKAARFAKR
jgi:hypothetical protein